MEYKNWTVRHHVDPGSGCIVLEVSNGCTILTEVMDSWVTNSTMKEEILWAKAKRMVQNLEGEIRKEKAAC